MIACNDDFCGLDGLESAVTFPAVEGSQYLIRIGGYFGQQGLGSMTIATNPADLNVDCKVNLKDLSMLAAPWRQSGCVTPTWCGGADIDHDGEVSLPDVIILADHWLEAGP